VICCVRWARILRRRRSPSSRPAPRARVRAEWRSQAVDYATFTKILNRPNGFKPAGTPGALLPRSHTEEFIRGFQVFDKDGTGQIGVGELRYVLTSLGEKLSDEEVDELLKGVAVSRYVLHTDPSDGSINYETFVRQILSQ